MKTWEENVRDAATAILRYTESLCDMHPSRDQYTEIARIDSLAKYIEITIEVNMRNRTEIAQN